MRIICAPYYAISNLDDSEKSRKKQRIKKDEKKEEKLQESEDVKNTKPKVLTGK